MKALRTFRKVVALTTGALMVGATLFGASAYTLADYPAMFIATPQLTKVVIGDKAAAGDVLGGIDVASSLTQEAAQAAIAAGGSSGSSGVTVVGESATLSSGTDHIYLGQTVRQNVQSLTDAELPTVLADGVFEDDAGDETSYEQSLKVGESASYPILSFAKPPISSEKNSVVHLLGDDNAGTNPALTFEITFDTAVDFTATASSGQELTLADNTYKVGTATSDTNGLVLYLSANTVTLKPGETKEVSVGEQTYTIHLLGVDTGGTKATVEVCNAACDTEEGTEGATKKVGGLDLFFDLVSSFNTEADPGFAVIGVSLAGQSNSPLYLADGDAVRVGSGKDDIDGTLVSLNPSGTADVALLTQIRIETTWAEDDDAWLVPGQSWTESVFNKVKLDFLKLDNGPQLRFASVHDDRADKIEVSIDDDLHLRVNWQHDNNDHTFSMIRTAAVGGVAVLGDDNNEPIYVVEGASLADEDILIIRSGQKTFMFQVKKITMSADDTANDDFHVKDLLTGELYKKDNVDMGAALDTTTFNAGGQTFLVQNVDTTHVRVFRGSATKQAVNGIWDDAANVAVFSEFTPYGTSADHQIFFAENVTALEDFNANAGNSTIATLTLPTGTALITANGTENGTTVTIDGTATALVMGTALSLAVGQVVYTFQSNPGASTGLLDVTVGLDANQDTATNVALGGAAVVLVEEEDNTNSKVKEAVIMHFDTGGTNDELEVAGMVATSTEVAATFDDSDYSGSLTPFGSLYLLSTTDNDQDVASLHYSKAQMAAHLAVSEATATIAGGAATVSGSLVSVSIGSAVLAGNLANYENWNVVSVGGPCANSVSAALLGNPSDCAEGFTAGKARILLFNHDNGNAAVLPAGYTEEDSQRATKVLANWRDYRSDFKGMELEVSGTSMSDLQVTSVLA